MAKEKTVEQLKKEAKQAIRDERLKAKEQKILNKFKEEELQLAKDIEAWRKSGLSIQKVTLKEFQKELRIQEEISAEKEKQQKAGKINQDLLSSTTSIGKKLTKELQKQSFSSKQSIGFGKLNLNYGKQWVEAQQQGVSTIHGIIDGSKEIANLKGEEKEQVTDLIADMDTISQGLVDQSGYKMMAAKYDQLAADALKAGKEDIAKMAEHMAATARAGGKYEKTMQRAKKVSEKMGSIWKKIVGFIGIAAIAVGIWNLLKKAAFSFSGIVDDLGKAFGQAGAEAGPLREQMIATRTEAIGIGKNLADVVEVTSSLTDEFGIGIDAAAEMADEILDSSIAMGLTNDEGARLFGTMMKLGKMSQKEAEHLAEGTYQLAKANKVNPAKVMKDIAKNTDYFAKYGAKGYKNIEKTAVQAAKLGISLSDVAGIAEGLLDFESSMAGELEMSMMLGRNINLQKARMLALDDDHEGMMKEVMKQVGGAAKWDKMRGVYKKSFAKMLGVEVQTMNKLALGAKDVAELTEEQKIDLKADDTMSGLTVLINKLKLLGAEIMLGIGEPLEGIMKTFQAWLLKAKKGGQTPFDMIRAKVVEIKFMIRDWGFEIRDQFKDWLDNSDVVGKIISGFNFLTGEIMPRLEKAIKFIWSVSVKVKDALKKAWSWIKKHPKLAMTIAGTFILWKTGILGFVAAGVKGLGRLIVKLWAAATAKKALDTPAPAGRGFLSSIKPTQMLAAGASMILLAGAVWVLAKAMQAFSGGKVDWEGVKMGAVSLLALTAAAFIISKFTASIVGGAFAMGVLGVATLIIAKAMQVFSKEVDWPGVLKGIVAMGLVATVAGILGIPAISAAVVIGAGVLVVLAAAIAIFAGAAMLGAVAMKDLQPKLENLATLDGSKLKISAEGIGAVGLAIAKFGGGSLLGGIGSAIGDFFGGDPTEKFKKFAEIGPGLELAGKGIETLSTGLNSMKSGMITASAKAIDKLRGALHVLTKGNLLKKFIQFSAIGPNLEKAGRGIMIISAAVQSFASFTGEKTVEELASVEDQVKKMNESLGTEFAAIGLDANATFATIGAAATQAFSGVALDEDVFSDVTLDTSGFQSSADSIQSMFELAWENIKDATSTVWDGIANIVLAPFRVVRTAIQGIINSVNGMTINYPDWPLVFGEKAGQPLFNFNIPDLPTLQTDFGQHKSIKETGAAIVHQGESIGKFDFQPVVSEIQLLSAQLAAPSLDMTPVGTAVADGRVEAVATKEEITLLRQELKSYFGLEGTVATKMGQEFSSRLSQLGG